MAPAESPTAPHRVVIVGSGFGGLNAAKALRRARAEVTLISKTSYHLFQPLLYQVATGVLSEGEVAPPARHILRTQRNVTVLLGEVKALDLTARTVTSVSPAGATVIGYDTLVVAAGATPSFFGNDEFATHAPSLKSIDDALEVRGRILGAFEHAELSTDHQEIDRCLTFVVVGAGPTGVEMAGQISELARRTLHRDFRNIDPTTARVILLDAADRVLPTFDPRSSARAARQLREAKVEVRLGTKVVNVDADGVEVQDHAGSRQRVPTLCKVWAAGVAASPLTQQISRQSTVETDTAGRLVARPDLTLPDHPEVFIVGDLLAAQPGVAQLAMQSGRYAGRQIHRRLESRPPLKPFKYLDKGNMATISRLRAVAEIGPTRFSGGPAWVMWLGLHLYYLVGFGNRMTTVLRWTAAFLGGRRQERTATIQQVLARQALERLEAAETVWATSFEPPAAGAESGVTL